MRTVPRRPGAGAVMAITAPLRSVRRSRGRGRWRPCPSAPHVPQRSDFTEGATQQPAAGGASDADPRAGSGVPKRPAVWHSCTGPRTDLTPSAMNRHGGEHALCRGPRWDGLGTTGRDCGQLAVLRFRVLDSLAIAMVMALMRAAAPAKRPTRSSPLPVVVPATRVAAMSGAKPPPRVDDSW